MSSYKSKFWKLLLTGCCILAASCVFSQKHDYNYLIRASEVGSGVFISYNDSLQDLEHSLFSWQGTVSGSPVLSDKNGKFLGYFNSRSIYDEIGSYAINGDSMAVGSYLNYLFSFYHEHFGLGNVGNCAFIPITDSLFYLFYKAPHLWIGEPGFPIMFEEQGVRLSSYSENIYLTKVRLSPDGRLFVLNHEKHLLLVEDLYQFRELIFSKHANGVDWWLIAPKALDDKASRILISQDGEISVLGDVVFSDNFWRVRSASRFAFDPEGGILARILIRSNRIFDNILELFTFDRCTGLVERFLVDSIPLPEQYSSSGDIEFSENGRFLYAAVGSIILQMDLHEQDFFQGRDTIAEWDSVMYYGLPPIFDQLWKLPNGKILVASAVATPFLHYIHAPDLPGDSCLFEQRAIKLPVDPLNAPFGVNCETLPLFPPFRMTALDVICSTSSVSESVAPEVMVYPNPAYNYVSFAHAEGLQVDVLDISGHIITSCIIPDYAEREDLDISALIPGIYIFVFSNEDGQIVARKKCVKL